MPFIWNKKIVPELYIGDREVSDVYKGNDLVWKRYKLNYHNISSNVTEYNTWGIGFDLKDPEISAADKKEIDKLTTTYENVEYVFKGWFSDPYLLNKVSKIRARDHEDIDLYAKWYIKVPQYRYEYYVIKRTVISSSLKNGVTSYQKQIYYIDPSVNGSADGDYPGCNKVGTGSGITVSEWKKTHKNWYNYTSEYAGQCTWYANGRTAQIHSGHGAPYGTGYWPNASDWASVNNAYWKGTRAPGYSNLSPKVGDVACFYDGSKMHVAVIESISGNTAILSHWNSTVNKQYTLKSNNSIRWTFGDPCFGISFYGYCCWAGNSSYSAANTTASNEDAMEFEDEYIYYYSKWQWTYPTAENMSNVETRYWYSTYDYTTSQWTKFSLEEP